MLSVVAPLDELTLFHGLMENNNDSVIYFKDRQCRLLLVSRKMANDLGFADPSELVGKDDVELFGAEFGAQTRLDDLQVIEDDRPIVSVTEARKLPDGRINWTSTSKQPLHDENGAVVGLVGITREITEMHQTEESLQYLATHDFLTDLPNRFLLTDRMNQLLARSDRQPTSFAVLFMDLDHFKEINDIYTHEAGDQLLRIMAKRLRQAVRASDTVARLGGDEFVLLLEALEPAVAAECVARKIEAAFALPFFLGRHQAKVGISIGISFHPGSGSSTDALLHSADRAMYQAKRAGGNCHRTCRAGLPYSTDICTED